MEVYNDCIDVHSWMGGSVIARCDEWGLNDDQIMKTEEHKLLSTPQYGFQLNLAGSCVSRSSVSPLLPSKYLYNHIF